ncbi:Heme exporter protein C [Commensalibacter sp. Nvir]|uniref:heme ABC transporter permease CcmC n=1 Tax=Commensalibacter sp. Nvir TaxID=3069817 RepID=UPI002D4C98F9|nr:Heme exporter protein C [Commensalibacter sp. Nvir]
MSKEKIRSAALANPNRFLKFSNILQPWICSVSLICITIGVIWGLFYSPPDWQQGDAVRIMYIHVPMALLSSVGYFLLALCALCSLVWKHPLADLAAEEIGPIGGIATLLCLITGSLWGKPMWGTWWVWDARLTSVLILLFFYIGHITLMHAFDDIQKGYKAAAYLALIGVFDLPIIKFSVYWWNTLHQTDTFKFTSNPPIVMTMIWPLLFCLIGFGLGFLALILSRVKSAILEHQFNRIVKIQLYNSNLL